MSNALPYSMSNQLVPAAPSSRPRAALQLGPVTMGGSRAFGAPPPNPPVGARPANAQTFQMPIGPAQAPRTTPPPPVPRTMPERMSAARERIRTAAEAGHRIRSYEVALDLDLSEFHFARQFRAAFGRSPHVYYDEVRAERARALLGSGVSESEVARRVGFRRPAELRALLNKRTIPACS